MATFRPSWLLYGATGYTGRLIATAARARGHNVILAGRDEAALQAQSKALGVSYRCFSINDREAMERGCTGIRLVLNTAGPHHLTGSSIAQACIRTGTHYLDISGEMSDHRVLQRLHDRAHANGVLLLPGVGFGVIPTDCLAVHMKERQPSAVAIKLAYYAKGSASQGTLHTLLDCMELPGFKRERGELKPAKAGEDTLMVDFGSGGKQQVLNNPWRGDLLSTYLSTGIGHVQTYAVYPGLAALLVRNPGLGKGWTGNMLRKLVRMFPEGPSDDARAKGKTWCWAEVVNEAGNKLTSVLEGPEAYTLTVDCALYAVEKVLEGVPQEGFASPGQVLGSAPLREIAGLKVIDTGS